MKALIFDFDGVLVLSERPRFLAIQRSARSHAIIIEDSEIGKMLGRTTIKFLNDVLAEKDYPLIPKIIKEYEKDYKVNITRYVEPVSFVINYIKNYDGPLTLALASMSSRIIVLKLLEHFDVQAKFKVIICKEDVTNHKPNPEIYLKTAEKLGISSSDCVAIEDTAIGSQAALSAGMKCYGLLNGFNHKDEFIGMKIEGTIYSSEDLQNIFN